MEPNSVGKNLICQRKLKGFTQEHTPWKFENYIPYNLK